jgi:hypothetical protein
VLGCLKHVQRLAHKRTLIDEVPEITKLAAPQAKFDFSRSRKPIAWSLLSRGVAHDGLVALHTGYATGS